jgi:hypothetical protein
MHMKTTATKITTITATIKIKKTNFFPRKTAKANTFLLRFYQEENRYCEKEFENTPSKSTQIISIFFPINEKKI